MQPFAVHCSFSVAFEEGQRSLLTQSSLCVKGWNVVNPLQYTAIYACVIQLGSVGPLGRNVCGSQADSPVLRIRGLGGSTIYNDSLNFRLYKIHSDILVV